MSPSPSESSTLLTSPARIRGSGAWARLSSRQPLVQSTCATGGSGGGGSPGHDGASLTARIIGERADAASGRAVSFEDATAYAAWAGKRLPTESGVGVGRPRRDRRRAVRVGRRGEPGGRLIRATPGRAPFPYRNTGAGGWVGTSPVGIVPAQRIRPARHDRQHLGVDDRLLPAAPRCSGRRPVDAGARRSARRSASPATPARVLKGGSHLCSPGVLPALPPRGAHAAAEDTAMTHIGFRCAR